MIVQIVRLLLLERDHQVAPARRDRGGVVPLEVVRRPVVQVDSLPVWVVPWVECAVWGVEFIGEDELVLDGGVAPAGFAVCGGGGVGVDEGEAARGEGRDLPRGVDPADVECAEGGEGRVGEVADDRVAGSGEGGKVSVRCLERIHGAR